MRPLGACWTAVCEVFTAVPSDPGAPVQAAGPSMPSSDEATFSTRLGAQLRGRPSRLVAACLATVLGPAVVAQARTSAAPAPEIRSTDEPSPAGAVVAPRPGDADSWLDVAMAASSTCPGLPPSVLVAIGRMESGLGVDTGTSSAGAEGPMQFLPSTWAAYGADGDGDGLIDVMNPVDAMYGAARLLCANGGSDPQRLPAAVWNYNHSDDYVLQVMTLARVVRF